MHPPHIITYFVLFFFCLIQLSLSAAKDVNHPTRDQLGNSIRSELLKARVQHGVIRKLVRQYFRQFSNFRNDLDFLLSLEDLPLLMLRTNLCEIFGESEDLQYEMIFDRILQTVSITAPVLANILLQVEWKTWQHTFFFQTGNFAQKPIVEKWIMRYHSLLLEYKDEHPLVFALFRKFFSFNIIDFYNDNDDLVAQAPIFVTEEEEYIEPPDAFAALKHVLHGGNQADSRIIPCSFSILALIYASNLDLYQSNDRANYQFVIYQFIMTSSLNSFDRCNSYIFIKLLYPKFISIFKILYLGFGNKLSNSFPHLLNSHPFSSQKSQEENAVEEEYYTNYKEIFVNLPNEALKFIFLSQLVSVYVIRSGHKHKANYLGDKEFSSKLESKLLKRPALDILYFYIFLLCNQKEDYESYLSLLHGSLIIKNFPNKSNKSKNQKLFYKLLGQNFGRFGKFILFCLQNSNPFSSNQIKEFNLYDNSEKKRDEESNEKNDFSALSKLEMKLLDMKSVYRYSYQIHHGGNDQLLFFKCLNHPIILEISTDEAYDTLRKSPIISSLITLPDSLTEKSALELYNYLLFPSYRTKADPAQSYVDFIHQHFTEYLQLLILNLGILQYEQEMQATVSSFEDSNGFSLQKQFISCISRLNSSTALSLDQDLSLLLDHLSASIHNAKFQSLVVSFILMAIQQRESKLFIFYNLLLDFILSLTRAMQLSTKNLIESIKIKQAHLSSPPNHPIIPSSFNYKLYNGHFNVQSFELPLDALASLGNLDLFLLIQNFILDDNFIPNPNDYPLVKDSKVFAAILNTCNVRTALNRIVQENFSFTLIETHLLSRFSYLIPPRIVFKFPNSIYKRPVSKIFETLDSLPDPDEYFNSFELACYYAGKVLANFVTCSVPPESLVPFLQLVFTSQPVPNFFPACNKSQILRIVYVFESIILSFVNLAVTSQTGVNRCIFFKLLMEGSMPHPIDFPQTDEEANRQVNSFFSFPPTDEDGFLADNESKTVPFDEEDTISYSSASEEEQILALSNESQNLVPVLVDLTRFFISDLFKEHPLERTEGLFCFIEEFIRGKEILTSQILLTNILLQIEWRLFAVSFYYEYLCPVDRALYRDLLIKGEELKESILSQVESRYIIKFFSNFISKLTSKVFKREFPNHRSQYLISGLEFSPAEADAALELIKKNSPPMYYETHLFSEKLVALLYASNLPEYFIEPLSTNYYYTLSIFLARTSHTSTSNPQSSNLQTSLKYLCGYFYQKKFYRFINEFIIANGGISSFNYFFSLVKDHYAYLGEEFAFKNCDLLGALISCASGAAAKQYLIHSFFGTLFVAPIPRNVYLNQEKVSFLNPDKEDPDKVFNNITVEYDEQGKMDKLIYRHKVVAFHDIAQTFIHLVLKIKRNKEENVVFRYINTFLSSSHVDDDLERARNGIWRIIIKNFSYFGIFLQQWSYYLFSYQPIDVWHFATIREVLSSQRPSNAITYNKHSINRLARLLIDDKSNYLVKPLVHMLEPLLIFQITNEESLLIVKNLLLVSNDIISLEGVDFDALFRKFLGKDVNDKVILLKGNNDRFFKYLCKYFVQSIIFAYHKLLDMQIEPIEIGTVDIEPLRQEICLSEANLPFPTIFIDFFSSLKNKNFILPKVQIWLTSFLVDLQATDLPEEHQFLAACTLDYLILFLRSSGISLSPVLKVLGESKFFMINPTEDLYRAFDIQLFEPSLEFKRKYPHLVNLVNVFMGTSIEANNELEEKIIDLQKRLFSENIFYQPKNDKSDLLILQLAQNHQSSEPLPFFGPLIFERASLLLFKLVKNLKREDAYPFTPQDIHLLFFSNLIPPGFTQEDITLLRKLILTSINVVVPEIAQISFQSEENEIDEKIPWIKRWKFICLTCPSFSHLIDTEFNELEAKAMYNQHTSIKELEIVSDGNSSNEESPEEIPKLKVAIPPKTPVQRPKNNKKKQSKKKQAKQKDTSAPFLYTDKKPKNSKKRTVKAQSNPLPKVSKNRNSKDCLENNRASSTPLIEAKNDIQIESSSNIENITQSFNSKSLPIYDTNFEYLFRSREHIRTRMSPPILIGFDPFPENPLPREATTLDEFLSRSIKDVQDLLTGEKTFLSSKSLEFFIENHADLIERVAFDVETSGIKCQSDQIYGTEYHLEVAKHFSILQMGFALLLKDGNILVFSIFTGPTDRGFYASKESLEFLEKHGFDISDYFSTRVDESFIKDIFKIFSEKKIPIIFHNGYLDALFLLKILKPEKIYSTRGFRSIESVESLFKDEEDDKKRMIILDTKHIFNSARLVWYRHLTYVYNSEAPDMLFHELKTYYCVFRKISPSYLEEIEKEARSKNKKAGIHSAGVDGYFTLEVFGAYLESKQVDVFGEYQGFINSEYRLTKRIA
jgi:hypothetical protein